MSGIDREGIGMLYAGGAGAMVGTSVVYATKPALGWVLGSLVIFLGVGYELYQRSVDTGTDQ